MAINRGGSSQAEDCFPGHCLIDSRIAWPSTRKTENCWAPSVPWREPSDGYLACDIRNIDLTGPLGWNLCFLGQLPNLRSWKLGIEIEVGI